jgi:hypothetical protein
MDDYEFLKAQTVKRRILAPFMPYIRHDFLCAKYEVKGGGCTCGLDVLLDDLMPAGLEAKKLARPKDS